MKHIRLLFILICVSLSSANLFAQSGWTVLQTPSKAQLNGIYFLSEKEGYVVGDTGTIFHTIDGGESWTVIPHPFSSEMNKVFLGDITVYNDSVIIVAGSIRRNSQDTYGISLIMRSQNRGQNWTVDTSVGTMDKVGRILTLVKTPWSLYALKSGIGASRLESKDTGRTWISEGSDYEWGGASNGNDRAMIVGAHGEPFICWVHMTTDRGKTWTSMYPDGNDGPGKPYVAKYSCVAHVKAKRWVVGSESAIWLTEDDGANWVGLEKTTTKNFNVFSMTFADTAIGFGSIGDWYFTYPHEPIKQAIIQKTTDGGLSWAPLITPSGVRFVNRMQALSPTVVYAVADSGIVLKTTNGGGNFVFSSVPTPYIEQSDITITPNPSQSNVTIQILSQTTNGGELEIRDVLGREVDRVMISPNTTSYTLDIRRYPAGAYYVRIGSKTSRFVKM